MGGPFQFQMSHQAFKRHSQQRLLDTGNGSVPWVHQEQKMMNVIWMFHLFLPLKVISEEPKNKIRYKK